MLLKDFLAALPFIVAWCLFLEYVLHPVFEAIADAVSERRFRRNRRRQRRKAVELGIDPDSLLATFL